MLRQGYYGALDKVSADPTPVASDGGPPSPIPGDFGHMPTGEGHGAHAVDHVQHCFDYLRQALLCAADQTLEERNDDISGVRGWGARHQCRDFGALKSWTENHRYSDEQGLMR